MMGTLPDTTIQARTFRYVAYGLRIESALALPELMPLTQMAAGAESFGDEYDVTVTVGVVPAVDPTAVDMGEDQWRLGDRVWLGYPGVCRILVDQGRSIVVDPVDGVEERVVRLYILGNAIGTLLHQRGNLVLHAGAVAVEGVAVAFVGFSRAGKSTMTATMVARGHVPIADDVVAVEIDAQGQPIVRFGFPQLKLHPDSASALPFPEATLSPLHPDFAKLGHQVPVASTPSACPLGAVYVLEFTGEDEPSIERLRPTKAMLELIRHSYAAKMLKDRAGHDRPASTVHFDQVATLAAAIPVSRLQRPKRLPDLQEVARLVERDCVRNLPSSNLKTMPVTH